MWITNNGVRGFGRIEGESLYQQTPVNRQRQWRKALLSAKNQLFGVYNFNGLGFISL